MNTEELKAYRAFMKKRELAQKAAKEAKTDESSDEEADPGSSNEDEVSGASAEDEEQMSSEEDWNLPVEKCHWKSNLCVEFHQL